MLYQFQIVIIIQYESKGRNKSFKSVALSAKDFKINRPDSPMSKRSRQGKSLYAGSQASKGRKISISNLDWTDRQQIFLLKYILKDFPESSVFSTNVLKICLNKHEEYLASIIVSHYNVDIDDGIVERAIEANMLNLLKVLFSYSKNFHYMSYK